MNEQYIDSFLFTLKELILEYDKENGTWQENEWEGKEFYKHCIWKFKSKQDEIDFLLNEIDEHYKEE